ncbi:MAG: hypothetical protein CMC14_07455 [Flavobacteriaceae bacterium]|nr:hypothetical protein [Flavobacteriaceae bacterium]
MRKIILQFFILFFGILSHSQSIEDNWHIKQLVINGITYDAPINEETNSFILFIYWEWDIYVFDNYHCGRLSNAYGGFWFDEDTIYLNKLEYSFEDCAFEENTVFSNLHFNFYLDDSDQEYGYLVEANSDGDQQLTITNEFGDQAIYINRNLNIYSYNIPLITLHPNPTLNTLFIASENLEITSLSIFNFSGQKVIKIKEATSEIDVSTLQSGIYFLEITSEEGTIIKKFVKK